MANAATRVTMIITITNNPIGNTNTLTLNADTRTWTNNINSNPGTLIAETNNIYNAATNLINHLTASPFTSGQFLSMGSSNVVRVVGLVDQTMAGSLVGNWGVLTYSTQTVASPTYTVRVPHTAEPTASVQTNIASQLVSYLALSTNALATNAFALSNMVSAGLHAGGGTQDVVGPKLFHNFQGTNGGIIQGGIFRNSFLDSPTSTNLVNYGNAIRSEGAGGSSLQLGSNALAHGASSVAVGVNAWATNGNTIAVGTSAKATNQYAGAFGNLAFAKGNFSTALGNGASAASDYTLAVGATALAVQKEDIAIGNTTEANGGGAVALGAGIVASGTNAVGIGALANASHARSVALGTSSSTTTSNQVVLGSGTHHIYSPGVFAGNVHSNSTHTGTNIFKANSALGFTPYALTSLANGNNAAIPIITNVIVEITSGPTGAFTINGISSTGVIPGQILDLVNLTGQAMTVAHQSGTDPTAANRIITMTGSDMVTTGNGAARFYYSTSQSRWICVGMEE